MGSALQFFTTAYPVFFTSQHVQLQVNNMKLRLDSSLAHSGHGNSAARSFTVLTCKACLVAHAVWLTICIQKLYRCAVSFDMYTVLVVSKAPTLRDNFDMAHHVKHKHRQQQLRSEGANL